MKTSASISRLMTMVACGIAAVCLITACGSDGDDSDIQNTVGMDQTVDGELPAGEDPARFTFQGGDLLEDLADFLSISIAQLRADLETPGATQAGVAALYGKSREELRQFLIEQNQETLDQAVEEGSMPKETADELHAAFLRNIDSMLDSSGGGAGGILIQPGGGPPPGSGEGPSFQTSP